MINVKIVIPWRATKSRIEIFHALISWYKQYFPEYEIILSDSGSDTFNASASKNIGIKNAILDGADVVIVSDADTFTDSIILKKAIEVAYNTDEIVIPYHIIRYIYPKGLDYFLTKNLKYVKYLKNQEVFYKPALKNNVPDRFYPCGGILAISSKQFLSMGQFDENFVGWGPEDQAFHINYYNKYNKLFTYLDCEAVAVAHSKSEWDNNRYNNNKYFKENYLKNINVLDKGFK